METQSRTAMSWWTAVATVAGVSLIGWAVDDVLTWFQRAALVFGVVLVAYARGTGRPDRSADSHYG